MAAEPLCPDDHDNHDGDKTFNFPLRPAASAIPPKPTAADQIVSIQPLEPETRCTIQAIAIGIDRNSAGSNPSLRPNLS
jgi:hypothetical protein